MRALLHGLDAYVPVRCVFSLVGIFFKSVIAVAVGTQSAVV